MEANEYYESTLRLIFLKEYKSSNEQNMLNQTGDCKTHGMIQTIDIDHIEKVIYFFYYCLFIFILILWEGYIFS